MRKKIKNIVLKIDLFLFRFFGSNKSIKLLEGINEVKLIFSALNESDDETNVKFVGGCVRKAFSGELIDDIDLATTLEPNEVKKRLSKKNIKVIDTGISHGTVTAIVNKEKFEITTLRKDISTDGRHAKVEFTLNWEEDASRRDFTINAIYSDIYGRIFDPFNGIHDLKNGVVRFVGIAEDRIQEDYLRILRYLRFFIQYSKTDYDEEIIKSIKKNINGLNKISNERIFTEIKKIFSLERVYNLFLNERSKEIILNVFPQFKYYERLKKLNDLNYSIKGKFDNILILALLIVDDSSEYEYFCHKFKTSNDIKKRFENISKNFENLKSKKFYTENNVKKMIYLSSKDSVKDLLLFSICINNKIHLNEIEKLINYTTKCLVPKFPISGDYLKQHGFVTGELLGKKLKLLEEQWIDNNFIIDKKEIEKSFKKANTD